MSPTLERLVKIVLLCLAAATVAVALTVPVGAAAPRGHARIPERASAKTGASSAYAETRAELRFEYLGGNLSQAERRTSEFEH
jgi:hypothetical protein